MSNSIILSWKLPNWHQDFGNPAEEFEHLQKLAFRVIAAASNACINFMTPEPGLMFIKLSLKSGREFEVYSVPSNCDTLGRKYAIFCNTGPVEIEEYFESCDSAVALIVASSIATCGEVAGVDRSEPPAGSPGEKIG
jgi:hypothetical protein